MPSRPLIRTLVSRHCCALLLASAGLAAGVARPAAAQTTVPLTVRSSTGLRTGPWLARASIRTLQPGERVDLLSVHTRNDYLHVASGADTGWVDSQLVELATPNLSVAVRPRPSTPGITTSVAEAPSAYGGCSLAGNPSPNNPAVAALRLLNEKKNRFHAPTDADIDPAVTLGNLLRPGYDVARFDDAKAGEIEGWIVNVMVGGVESVNCKARDPSHRDTHIEIAARPNAPETERVIVEVTPRWRAAMRAAGVDWTTDGLRALVGKRVRVRGWMLFDEDHRYEARNTATRNAGDWRATVWELHPVTALVVTSP